MRARSAAHEGCGGDVPRGNRDHGGAALGTLHAQGRVKGVEATSNAGEAAVLAVGVGPAPAVVARISDARRSDGRRCPHG